MTKKYAPLLGFTEQAKEPVAEPSPAPARTPAPKPAPAPKAEGYTPEQESMIDQYMKQYPGYSREQIIQAMKGKGYL